MEQYENGMYDDEEENGNTRGFCLWNEHSIHLVVSNKKRV